MKTLLLNMSPKGATPRSSGQWIAEAFAGKHPDMSLRAPIGAPVEAVLSWIRAADAVLFIVPLYIHGMPGSMMRWIETWPEDAFKGRRVGFIVQLGFTESAQARFLLRYFECLLARWQAVPIGMTVKGGAAAIFMMPRMFWKVLKQFALLGERYRETGMLDETISRQLAAPESLTRSQCRLIQFFCDIGLNNLGWHQQLRKNGALANRLDRPFLN